MMHITHNFAAAEAAGNDSLLGALGIDLRLLVLQIIAFAILVWVLGKFVYPILIRAIDKREQAIADSVKAANEAEQNAEKTQVEIEKLFKQAREESAAIVETAHKEAAVMVKDAEDKAKKRADQIVADARAQLDQDVLKARKALRDEATELVALATEKIVREKVDATKDKALITNALREAEAA
jgi:F-type H+-transporting ATPase subunit b